MSYCPDEYDLEQSHELERRLDRDFRATSRIATGCP